jgi:hypothetical protein
MGEVESFIRADVPGHSLTYYTADNSRGYDGLDKCLHGSSNATLRGLVDRIRRLANAGQVDLVQARRGDRTLYQAIWRRRLSPLAPDARLPRLVA